jgi:hypothetical protein
MRSGGYHAPSDACHHQGAGCTKPIPPREKDPAVTKQYSHNVPLSMNQVRLRDANVLGQEMLDE